MRVLYFSGYTLPVHHRKVELLADQPDIELVHIVGPNSKCTGGRYLSANQQRTFTVHIIPTHQFGRANDPHRFVHWPPDFGLSAFNPDLIHCEHEQESLVAAQVALARDMLRLRAPLILYSWQNVVRPRRWWVRLVCAYTRRAAQHILCASQQAVDALYQQGYRGGVTVTLLHGLDLNVFYPRPVDDLRSQLGLTHFTIGYVGRLVPEKGIDTLLHAVARLPQAANVILLGENYDQTRYETLAAELGIRERCRFIRSVPYEQVPDFLSALDVLVLPSRTTPSWKEQFGRVLIEAMACQVPVVGSSSGAIPEVIGNPEQVFPEGDADALMSVLHQLITQPIMRQTWAEEGYQRATAKYSVHRLAQTVLDVWRTLVPQR